MANNKFKINCMEVYQTGVDIEHYKNEFDTLLDNYNNLLEKIHSNWSGDDYDNFSSSFSTYVENLKEVSYFLDNSSRIMKNSALRHGSIDNNLKDKVKLLGDDNEYKH